MIALILPLLLGGRCAWPPCPMGWDQIPPEAVRGDIRITLSTPRETYSQGERIRVAITYSNGSGVPIEIEARDHDRSGRVDDVRWFAERTTDTLAAVDPLAGCFGPSGGGVYRVVDPIRPGEKFTHTIDLNEWLWFPEPGEYRLRAVANFRVDREHWLSEPLTLTIHPRSPELRAAIVSRYRGTQLDGEDRREMRYLHDPVLMPYYVAMLRFDPYQHGYFAIMGTAPSARETLGTLMLSEMSNPLRPPTRAALYMARKLAIRTCHEEGLPLWRDGIIYYDP